MPELEKEIERLTAENIFLQSQIAELTDEKNRLTNHSRRNFQDFESQKKVSQALEDVIAMMMDKLVDK